MALAYHWTPVFPSEVSASDHLDGKVAKKRKTSATGRTFHPDTSAFLMHWQNTCPQIPIDPCQTEQPDLDTALGIENHWMVGPTSGCRHHVHLESPSFIL